MPKIKKAENRDKKRKVKKYISDVKDFDLVYGLHTKNVSRLLKKNLKKKKTK